jgi:hypothetical protein
MLRCQNCQQEAVLILSTCAACDPELHAAHTAALKSVIDEYSMTPEVQRYFEILSDRKINGYGDKSREPIGILGQPPKE